MRKALVLQKTCVDDAHEIHLEADDGIVRVVIPVPKETWDRVTVGVSVGVPDGDLNNKQVQAGITWTF